MLQALTPLNNFVYVNIDKSIIRLYFLFILFILVKFQEDKKTYN